MASAVVRKILIDTGSSVDIITWDYLRKLKYLGREIVPLVHPILGFERQVVNPTWMIHLPLPFGGKAKARNLEGDFLVVDVPTAYNVILEWLTLYKIKDPYTSNIGILIIITILVRCGLIAFTVRGRGLTIQRCGLLIAWTIFINCGRIEVHQLRVMTLGLGLTTILNILDICLEIAVLVESVRSQGHQEFSKEFYMVLMSPPIALMLDLSRFLSSRRGLDPYSGVGFFQLALQVASRPLSLSLTSSRSICTSLQSPLIFSALFVGRRSACPGPKQMELTPMTFSAWAKA
ncbi:hypothetical protein Cgig2_004298 [Carnegiea gigantea]|uniref:Uncharacterized protein n=1 Tax=Carnegiea gigantea TaxID=171969 RepID=A0A9Q1QA36_9CARY|nr:hypothetical protein Cgig2_004298 [Carnegiea gigantea]